MTLYNIVGIAAIGVLVAGCGTAASASLEPISGYIRRVPPESGAERQARLKTMAERRAGSVIICHRGASAFAPENTLEAFAAALDQGADGFETDVARTADGVLVCTHDSYLERVTNGFGMVAQHTYYELLSLDLQSYGMAAPETRIPTLAAVLELAKQRRMLVLLDVKNPALQDEVVSALDAGDAWDNVMGFMDWSMTKLVKNPKFKPVGMKRSFIDDQTDMNPEVIKKQLPCPGHFLFINDPRVAARELGRKPCKSVRLPKSLREEWQASVAPDVPDSPDWPRYSTVRSLNESAPTTGDLLKLLADDAGDRTDLTGGEGHQRQRAEQITRRAWAAYRLGQTASKTAYLVHLLERQVKHISLDKTGSCGFDGVMAARALGMLGALESVPVLVESLRNPDPELKKIATTDQVPYSWNNPVQKAAFCALAQLHCEASLSFLREYVSLSESQAEAMGYPRFALATEALLGQNPGVEDIRAVLMSPNSSVRGTGIRYCLDHQTKAGDAALKEVVPWALDLPRAHLPSVHPIEQHAMW